MPNFARSLSLLLAAAAAAAPASAAPPDPALYSQLHWRSIGPFRGGRVLAVTGVSDDPLHFYFGAVNGGVWETRDAGRTWLPIFDEVPVGSIGAIAVAPSNPKRLYVGTGEADMRSDIAQGIGMFRSDDGGKAWRSIGLSDTQQISKILVDPRNPDVVLVAALGHPYGPNAERGVFRSTDGGRTWAKTLFKDDHSGAIALAFKPGDPSTVYAALWQTRRPPWSVYPASSGPGSGLYKSRDGGRTWAQIKGRGLPENPGRIGLALSPARPNRVYALIDQPADADGGLYRSDDQGARWKKVSSDKRIWNRGWYFGELTVDPANADKVSVLNTIILSSTDGGRNFVPIKGDPTGDDFHILWIDPKNNRRQILGIDQGTLVTLNGGKTWSSWFNQPTGQFYHVSTDNRFPYRVYGSQQDSGAAGVSSRGWGPDGVDISVFHEITAGYESDNIAPDPDDPDTIFGGRVDKLDLRSGQTRSVDPTLALPAEYRGEWTLPLAWGPRDHALYFGNQRIFRTADSGEHWAAISPDLTRPNPGIPANLDPTTAADDSGNVGARKGVVYAIGPSPIDAGDLWAGTDDGLVWRTRDGGAHWADITPAGLAAWSKIGTVEPSHFDRDTAYLAIDRHRIDDPAPYAMRTHDGGRNWQSIANGLGDSATPNSVNVVREDPVRPGLLYAGTEHGAFVSFDEGNSWQPLRSGLPATSVRDITVHDADLVIATHGRGFYILDDIAALRELAGDPAAATRLFAPAPAIRLHIPQFTGTPKPKDEPMAPNAPDGAIIDYYLAAASTQPVQIVIQDPSGTVVRGFSSADPVKPADLKTMTVAPEWYVPAQPPGASAGAHRFIWDLRLAALGKPDEPGVWAVPGRYFVRLLVNGQTYTQPIDVRGDPRVSLPDEVYQRQFVLARQIAGDQHRAQAALDEAAKLADALKAALAGPSGASRDGLAAARTQLFAVSGIPDPAISGNAPLPALNSLATLADTLGKLRTAVDEADADPSPDARAGYAAAAATLATTLQQWAEVKARLALLGVSAPA